VGETAALLLTLGTNYRLAQGLSSSARVLSVHLYILVKEGISFERAFATGTILIAIVLLVNIAATRLIRRVYGN
jgi:phosphate transport system permease protein